MSKHYFYMSRIVHAPCSTLPRVAHFSQLSCVAELALKLARKAACFGTLLFLMPASGFGLDHSLAAEQCIAENSGAGSLDCLENIFRKTEQELTRLERRILSELKDRGRSARSGLAVSSLREASIKFRQFSKRQCDFALGASAAVASGSGQVHWTCLIKLNSWRIKELEDSLLLMSRK